MIARKLASLVLAVVCFSTAAEAQLDEHCTVAIMNRTAQVSPDGSWILQDVPATLGPVRARAICIENGITRVGSSEMIDVEAGGTVQGIDIAFAVVPPIPAQLTLSATSTSLAAAGATAQLTASALFTDGTSRDVTAAGTAYLSSNPTVATVSATGLITARTSGNVIVSAMNEGTLAMLRVTVASTVDSDADGMPDDYEIANGFNPYDPNDARLDADGDGLTNLEEYRRGSNPNGVDSDGDGVGDGLEVQTGTDPLNPASFDLKKTLRSIRVNPSTSVDIALESLLGTASRAVQVVGTLIDGSSIDLTPRARGTNYVTANPAVAAPGTTDGEVLAVSAGSTTLTVTNNGFSAFVPVNVTTFTPLQVGSLSFVNPPQAIAVSGSYAYMMTSVDNLLHVVDVRDRRAPARIATLFISGYTSGPVVASHDKLFVADSTGVTVVSVATPSAPQVVTHFAVSGGVSDIGADSGYLVLATPAAVVIIDEAGTPVSQVSLANVRSVSIKGAKLIAALDTSGRVYAIDVLQGFATPVQTGFVTVSGATSVRVWGEYAYVAASTAISIVDIGAPAPRIVSTLGAGGTPLRIFVREGFCFIGAPGTSGVRFADVGNAAAPSLRSNVAFGYNVLGIAADQRFVYLGGGPSSGAGQLSIVQYFNSSESLDAPPSVRITSPAGDTQVVEGATLPVTISATDDGMVDSVSLSSTRGLFTTTKTRPATISYRVPSGITSTTITATATDFGANTSASQPIRLTIVKDTTPPTVRITAPTGPTIAGGQTIKVTADASDDAAVAAVQFFANGTSIGTSTTAPYSVNYFVPTTLTSVTFTATATDASGNSATSLGVTVSVSSDQPPTISIIAPLTGDGLYTGADVHVLVDAKDDVGLRYVSYLVNGSYLRNTAYNAPYDMWFSLPANTSSVQIIAEATDTKNQVTRSAPVTLNLATTSVIAVTPLNAYPWDILVQNGFGYVATNKGVEIFDVSNVAAPVRVGSLALSSKANALRLRGKYLLVANDVSGLTVIDVSSPSAPVLVTTLPTPTPASTIDMDGNLLFLSTDLGALIYDIRNPAAPQPLSMMPTTRPAHHVAVKGTTAFVVQDNEAVVNSDCSKCSILLALDISSPASPQRIGSIIINADYYSERSSSLTLFLDGNVLYVAGNYYLSEVNVSDPAAMRELNYYDQQQTYHCCYYGGRVLDGILFTGTAESPSAVMIDGSDPAAIQMIGRVVFSTSGNLYASNVLPTPDLVFVVGGNSNASGASVFQLGIGRYRTLQDTAGRAPSVAITRPGASQRITERESLAIHVDAADDIGVKTVAIAVDGQPVATLTAPPYDFAWDVPTGSAPHTISATAVDFGGNSGSAVPITFSAVADTTPPTVAITSPRGGASVPGSVVVLRAAATDDLSVTAVTFLVNGQPVGSVTKPPYELTWAVPAGMLSFTVGATATDQAGNVGTAAAVGVSVSAARIAGSITLPGPLNRLAVNGRYAFVGAGAAGFHVVDINDPASPVLVTTVPLANVTDVRQFGNYLYVASQDVPMLFDVTNPAAPLKLSQGPAVGSHLDVIGTHAYVANASAMTDIDFADPTLPRQISQVSQGRGIYGVVRALGPYAMVTTSGEIEAFDTRRSLALFPMTGYYDMVGNQILSTTFTDIGAAADGLVAFSKTTGMSFATLTTHFFAATILNDASHTFSSTFAQDQFVFSGRATRVTPSVYDLLVYDVGNHVNPVNVANVDLTSLVLASPAAIATTPTTAVLTADTKLVVVHYRQFSDTRGVAPAVSVGSSGTLTPSRLIKLGATASDDVAVASVTFIVDGTEVFTDTAAPYEMQYRVPSGVTSINVTARATDFGGNSTTSAVLRVP